MAKTRIDRLLVERGIAPTREKAQALLMAGQVLVNDRPIVKAGAMVREDAQVLLKAQLPYVGRGGVKLAHALSVFGLSVGGAVGPGRGRLDGRLHRLPPAGRRATRLRR